MHVPSPRRWCLLISDTRHRAAWLKNSIAATVLVFAGSSAQAAEFYWDNNSAGTTPGAWGTPAQWSTAATGGSNPASAPGAADDVFFNVASLNSGQTIYFAGDQSANSLTFTSSGNTTLQTNYPAWTSHTFTLGTGGITINDGAGTVSFNNNNGTTTLLLAGNQNWANHDNSLFTVNFNVSNTTASTLSFTGSGTGGTRINGIISDGAGATSVTINTTGGTTTLAGNNTYSGATTVTNGTLTVSGTLASTSINIHGGTLNLGSSNRLSDSATVTLAGGTLGLGSNNDTVGAFIMTSGTLGGSGTLTAATYDLQGGTLAGKLGVGTATVTSGTTNLTGTLGTTTLNLNSGTLALGSNNRISDSTAVLLDGGTLDIGTFNDTVGAVTYSSGSIEGSGILSATSFNFTNTSDVVLTTRLGGTGTLTKNGSGDLTLAAQNTFSAPVTVNVGTLILAHSSALGGSSWGNTIADGATLALQGGINVKEGGFTVGNTGTIRNRSGDNTLGGQITVGSATTFVSDSGTLTFTGSPQINANILNITGAGDIHFSADVHGSGGGFAKTGTGTLTLSGSGANSFHNLFINEGVVLFAKNAGTNAIGGGGTIAVGDGSGAHGSAILRLGANNQIPDHAGNFSIASDGRFDLNNFNESINVVSGTGNIELGSGKLTVGINSSSFAFDGTITGTGSLVKAGSGAATLTGASTYTGGTTISAGTLAFGADNILADTGAISITGGKLDIGAFNDTVGAVTLTAGSISGTSGTLTASSFTFTHSSDVTVSAILGGTGNLTKSGNGALTLSGANTFSGTTTISGGSLTLGHSLALQNSTLSYDNHGGSLKFGSLSSATLGGLGGAQNLALTNISSQGVALTVGANDSTTTYSGVLSGTGSLAKTGSGTLTLSGANTFTGTIDIQQGTLAVAANNGLGAKTNAVTVQSGATFALAGGSNATNTIGRLEGTGIVSIGSGNILKVHNTSANTFDGRLSGSGLFEKIGTGTFTFSSTANTDQFHFDGTVRLTSGTLEFAGGSGVLNTSTNALFIDTLELTGGTLLLSEAYINVGTLNITGDTLLDFGTSGSSILNADNIYIAAGKTLLIRNWTSEVDFLFANYDFRQIDENGTLAIFNQIGASPQNQIHFENDPESPDGSRTAWINYGHNGFNDWQIRPSPVPEPSTYGALLLASSLAFLLHRRSRKTKTVP
jgi:PEP-CTERM putative exosortase interaction domain/autotransporter-associated beta strand repeat